MNKRFIFLILVLFAHFAHGQSHTLIQRLISLTDHSYFPEVEAKLDSFRALFKGERTAGKLTFYNKRRPFRAYGMGIEEYTLNFSQTVEINGSSSKSEQYKLTILFDQRDSIVFYNKLVKYAGYYEYKVDATINYDSIRFENYFVRHDSLFATVTPRDYENPPFFSDKYFGPECMDHVSPQRDEMLKAVATKRKDILLSWLKSFNIEDKTYGATGLYLYKMDGGFLSDEEEILLKRTQQLRADVQTDLGIRYIYYFLYEGRLEREFEYYFDGKSQEEKLIVSLKNVHHSDQYDDSTFYHSNLNRLVKEITKTLQHDDITTFYQFKHLADSLDFGYEMNPSESSEYAIFTFRYQNENWNYLLRNHEIIFKEEQVFHHFHEVHELKPTEFLLITRMNQMSYSCYEAFVFNDLNRTNGTHCLSVCSWTNVDESHIDGRDSLTGEPILIGRLANHDPIPINYNSRTKSISYTFNRISDDKTITRNAKYINGEFIIESYDVQEEGY